jgi:uncharacterized protein (TIGR02246 family)
MIRLTIAALLLTFATVGYSQGDNRSASLERFFEDLGAAAVAGDRQAYSSLFRPEGALFLPHRPPIIGREAIGDFFDNFRTKLQLQLDIYEQVDIEIVGDVAMVRSHSVGTYVNVKTGKEFPYNQKYLDVLRFEDGQWLMSYHMAISNVFDHGVWETDWESE